MPTKSPVISAVLFMLVATASAQAEPAMHEEAAFQPNIEPVEMPQPTIQPPTDRQYDESQAYRLEYKYRAPDKLQAPHRVKSELPAAGGRAVRAIRQPLSDADTDDMPNAKLAVQPFSNEIALAARVASLDPALVHAVIFVESRYQRSAISEKGAIGLMQVLPGTAARYGVKDPGQSPKANLTAGTLYLRDLMRMFDNRLDLALAAYNAGEGAVMKYAGQVPPYRETKQYVLAVISKYNEWRNLEATSPPPSPPVSTTPEKPARKEYLPGTRLVLLSDEASMHHY